MHPSFWFDYAPVSDLMGEMIRQANSHAPGDPIPDCAYIPGIGWVWSDAGLESPR